MISNPARRYVTGSESKSFIYEGGKTLYHFSPYDNGLSGAMECNVIFFANSKEHAKDVLKRMFEHIISCQHQYVKSKKDDQDPHGFVELAEREIKLYQVWLKAVTENKIKIEQAPINQFYKVGWAVNDTL